MSIRVVLTEQPLKENSTQRWYKLSLEFQSGNIVTQVKPFEGVSFGSQEYALKKAQPFLSWVDGISENYPVTIEVRRELT